ncbi:MAG: hypothetical protein ABI851_14130 [Saprospiraceae bacterium]
MLWHLNEFQWIELPGIGFFKGDIAKAKIDEARGLIFPSKLSISLNPQANQMTEEMVDNIVTETGYEKESIEQSLASLVYHLGTELRVRKEVIFEPFGKLFYTNENNVLQFLPTETNLHDQFFGMKEYPLKKIQDQKLPPIIAIVEKIEKKSPNNGSVFNRKILYLLALLWLLFLVLLFCPAKKNNKTLNDSLKIDSLKVLENDALAHDSSLAQKIDTASINKLNSDSTIPVKTEESIPANKQEFTKEEEITSTEIERLNEKVKNKNCVIIVGSFKKIVNAKRQSQRVIKLKYEVYTENFGEFHRVGVKFDCLKRDLKIVLEELKQQFTNDAWILKY